MNIQFRQSKRIAYEVSDIIINEISSSRYFQLKRSQSQADIAERPQLFQVRVSNQYNVLRKLLRRKSQQNLLDVYPLNKQMIRLETQLVGYQFKCHQSVFRTKQKLEEEEKKKQSLNRGLKKQKSMRKGSCRNPDIVYYNLRPNKQQNTLFPSQENPAQQILENSLKKIQMDSTTPTKNGGSFSIRKASNITQSPTNSSRKQSNFMDSPKSSRKNSSNQKTPDSSFRQKSNNHLQTPKTPLSIPITFSDHIKVQQKPNKNSDFKQYKIENEQENIMNVPNKKRGNSFHAPQIQPVKMFSFLEEVQPQKSTQEMISEGEINWNEQSPLESPMSAPFKKNSVLLQSIKQNQNEQINRLSSSEPDINNTPTLRYGESKTSLIPMNLLEVSAQEQYSPSSQKSSVLNKKSSFAIAASPIHIEKHKNNFPLAFSTIEQIMFHSENESPFEKENEQFSLQQHQSLSSEYIISQYYQIKQPNFRQISSITESDSVVQNITPIKRDVSETTFQQSNVNESSRMKSSLAQLLGDNSQSKDFKTIQSNFISFFNSNQHSRNTSTRGANETPQNIVRQNFDCYLKTEQRQSVGLIVNDKNQLPMAHNKLNSPSQLSLPMSKNFSETIAPYLLANQSVNSSVQFQPFQIQTISKNQLRFQEYH